MKLVISLRTAVLAVFVFFMPTTSGAGPVRVALPNTFRQNTLLTCPRKIAIFRRIAEKADKEFMKALGIERDLRKQVEIAINRREGAGLTVQAEGIALIRLDNEVSEFFEPINAAKAEIAVNKEKAQTFREVSELNTKTLGEISKRRDISKVASDAATKKTTIAKVRLEEATNALDTPPSIPGELAAVVSARSRVRRVEQESNKAQAELADLEEQVITLKGEVTSADTKVQVFTENIVKLSTKLVEDEKKRDAIRAKSVQQDKVLGSAKKALRSARIAVYKAEAALADASKKANGLQSKAESAEARLEKIVTECKN